MTDPLRGREPDLRVISLGAGVQSTTLYLMACEHRFDVTPNLAIFADTQDESEATYRWLNELRSMGSIPIRIATAGKLSTEVLRSMRETPSGFCPIPTYVANEGRRESQGRRQCTRTHKTQVVYNTVREALGLRPGQRTKALVELWIGISVDEAHRAKPSRYPILEHRWPLLYDVPMRRYDCMKWLEEKGLPVPPKSSCVYCPFRSDRDWIAMKRDQPEDFEAAVRFESEMRALDQRQFLHDSCKPLDSVDFDPARTLDLFGNECEGMCGV